MANLVATVLMLPVMDFLLVGTVCVVSQVALEHIPILAPTTIVNITQTESLPSADYLTAATVSWTPAIV